ncbi:hypothetical protein [Herbiconiux sp. UC225_62]|uniref:hypothetical protein n=1 Tax=Herbiconiux sp. UC225_62 TaxID=3350168 RepID=UPI0036D3F10C
MIRHHRAILATIPLAIVIGLSGCAAGATADIASGTSELMQSTVVTAADQAASGDSSGALATLDSLQEQLDKASAAGDVSTSRVTAIQAAIDQLRSDLQPAPAVEPAPEEAPTTEPATTDDSGGTDPVTDTPAVSDDPATDDSGNSGKNDKPDKADKPEKPDKPDKNK